MSSVRARVAARWASGILLLVTIGVVLWLGSSPTSFALSNGVGDVTCRAVLAPTTNTGLIGDEELPTDLIEEWLLEVGYVDDSGELSAEDVAAATDRALVLCTDARVTRAGWMIVAGLVGVALGTFSIVLLTRPQ